MPPKKKRAAAACNDRTTTLVQFDLSKLIPSRHSKVVLYTALEGDTCERFKNSRYGEVGGRGGGHRAQRRRNAEGLPEIVATYRFGMNGPTCVSWRFRAFGGLRLVWGGTSKCRPTCVHVYVRLAFPEAPPKKSTAPQPPAAPPPCR